MSGYVKKWLPLFVILSSVIFSLAAAFFIDVWTFFPNAWPSFGTLAQEPSFAEAQVAAANDLLNMLMTFLIGLFILVGAIVQKGFASHEKMTPFQLVMLCLFCGFAIASASFLFHARTALAYQLSFGSIDLRQVVALSGVAAAFLGMAFLSAVSAAAVALTNYQPGGQE